MPTRLKNRTAGTELPAMRFLSCATWYDRLTALDQRRKLRFGPGSATLQAIACPYQAALGFGTRQWITPFGKVNGAGETDQ